MPPMSDLPAGPASAAVSITGVEPGVTTDAAAPERPRRPRRAEAAVWPLLRRLHFYAGVFVAPFLVIAAVTGLAYVFTPQLDQFIYPDQLRAEQAGRTPRPLAEQVAAARRAHPEGAIAKVTPAASPDATTRVVLSLPELGEKQRTVFVDPSTAAVRGVLTTWFDSTPARTWFDDLHRNLHLGVVGRHYSELAASWLWVVVGGGLLLWLGRARAYRSDRRLSRALLVDRSAQGVRRTRGWHASLGVWLAVGLLFLSATGLTWSRYAGARFDLLQGALGAHAPEIDATLPEQHADADAGSAGHAGHASGGAEGVADLPAGVEVDRVVQSARDAGLDGPIEVSPPADEHTGWIVAQVDDRWPVRQDQVAVDPERGAVIAHSRWADVPLLAKLSTLGVSAHMGVLFGLVNQLLLAAVAIGLLVMIFWGYRMWWQRRPTRDDRRARFGTPPVRGAWRGLGWRALLPGGLVVAALGWALPVLGVSLLCFLAVDVAIGSRHNRRGTPARPRPS